MKVLLQSNQKALCNFVSTSLTEPKRKQIEPAFISIKEKQKERDQLLQEYYDLHELGEERLPNTLTFMDHKNT